MSRSFFWENLVFDLISRLVPRVIVRGHAVRDIFLLVPVHWSVVGGQSMVPFFREKKFRLFLTDSQVGYVDVYAIAEFSETLGSATSQDF